MYSCRPTCSFLGNVKVLYNDPINLIKKRQFNIPHIYYNDFFCLDHVKRGLLMHAAKLYINNEYDSYQSGLKINTSFTGWLHSVQFHLELFYVMHNMFLLYLFHYTVVKLVETVRFLIQITEVVL